MNEYRVFWDMAVWCYLQFKKCGFIKNPQSFLLFIYESMCSIAYYIESYIISLFLKSWCLNVFHNSEVLTSDIWVFLSTQQEMDCISVSYLLEEQSAEEWDLLFCSLKLRSHAENQGITCLKDKRANSSNRVQRQNVDKAFKILPFSSAELILSCYNLASTVPSIFSYWS